jgi:hypothetical protein
MALAGIDTVLGGFVVNYPTAVAMDPPTSFGGLESFCDDNDDDAAAISDSGASSPASMFSDLEEVTTIAELRATIAGLEMREKMHTEQTNMLLGLLGAGAGTGSANKIGAYAQHELGCAHLLRATGPAGVADHFGVGYDPDLKRMDGVGRNISDASPLVTLLAKAFLDLVDKLGRADPDVAAKVDDAPAHLFPTVATKILEAKIVAAYVGAMHPPRAHSPPSSPPRGGSSTAPRKRGPRKPAGKAVKAPHTKQRRRTITPPKKNAV